MSAKRGIDFSQIIVERRKMRDELRYQVNTLREALGRLEGLDSEAIGRCYTTEKVRRAIKRGTKILQDIKREGHNANRTTRV